MEFKGSPRSSSSGLIRASLLTIRGRGMMDPLSTTLWRRSDRRSERDRVVRADRHHHLLDLKRKILVKSLQAIAETKM
jgi:hypothetical protein